VLLVGGEAAERKTDDGGRALGSGGGGTGARARVFRKAARSGVQQPLNRPEKAAWRAGPRPQARAARAQGRARLWFGRGTGKGMMGGARPSASAGWRRAGGPDWAGSGAGLRRGGRKSGGPVENRGLGRTLLGGCAETRKKRKNVFLFFLKKQTNEFKHKFESKQSNTMQQHICINKLLYFII
jgi:hypothetical protein